MSAAREAVRRAKARRAPTLREFREADARRWWIAPAVH